MPGGADGDPMHPKNGRAADVDFARLDRKLDELAHEIRRRVDAERSASRLAQLQELTAAFSEARTSHEVLTVVVSQGCAALGAPRAAVAVLDGEGAALEVLRAIGYTD